MDTVLSVGAAVSDHRQVCAFCGACDEMSHEHVFPQWIAELLRRDPGSHFRVARLPHSDAPSTWSTLTTDPQVWIGRKCNSGWMSRLEGETASILRKLIRPTTRRVTLPIAAQAELSAWITKTVFMSDLAHKRRVIPAAEYRLFYETRSPPDRAAIWLCAYQGAYDMQTVRKTLVSQSADGTPNLDNVHGVVATMVIGRLAIQFAWAFNGQLAIPVNNADVFLTPIWPPQERSQFWPSGPRRDSIACDEDELASLAGRFGVGWYAS